MHEQMQKNQEKYAAVEDPEMTSLEIGIAGVKIQAWPLNGQYAFSRFVSLVNYYHESQQHH